MSQKLSYAIIGGGISGLTSAYLLHQLGHEFTVFEAASHLGGHTKTLTVADLAPSSTAHMDPNHYFDTGFMVFNDQTYPQFKSLLDQLGVAYHPTEMSFSVDSKQHGIAYNGHSLNSLFAQRSLILSPKYWGFLKDILKFNRLAKAWLKSVNASTSSMTLKEFIDSYQLSGHVYSLYIRPMAGAIWSTAMKDVDEMPAYFVLSFFLNHGLLNIMNRPQWYVVTGGASQYLAPLTQAFAKNIRLNTPVESVMRHDSGVTIKTNEGSHQFDKVIFACHSDTTLSLLEAPTPEEKVILGAFPYEMNEVVLHQDTTVMPSLPLAWAAWNVHESKDDTVSLSYWLNRLQGLKEDETYLVTVNPVTAIDEATVLHRFHTSHPRFTLDSYQAQRRHNEINGQRHSYFCGAYWRHGFHEDGVVSALQALAPLGAQPFSK